jgi:flavin-binding protein dodecin
MGQGKRSSKVASRCFAWSPDYQVNQGLQKKEEIMADSVYKVIELVGTSTESWEKAAGAAVEQAAKSLRDLRIAEVVEMDLQIDEGKVRAYRTKIKVSFKYEKE